ncbi:transcriptional corepressor LEUNIG-like [Panicum hallii]|uniref:transcriptional corepressor LEUNIG-like n=1 Tax=Panicum hallii TaxID=206008 RepID=UPI000DF4D7CA|nr:transcriptional corepressor LEUNIG-like [Panicum hallii]
MRPCVDSSEVYGFGEIAKASASGSKVTCCDISSDGKLLATGGHDKKAVLWCTEPLLEPKSSLEEHSMLITDVRFSPSMPRRLATSSFDRTLRVWDADETEYSLRTFTGHQASITSLDFHPNKQDVICSCDGGGQVRSWSTKYANCLNRVKVSRGLRFQPRRGKYLATASEKAVFILDGETQIVRRSPLQGHSKDIQSLCWDSPGDYLASVSEDSVRIWSFASGHDVFGTLGHKGKQISYAQQCA